MYKAMFCDYPRIAPSRVDCRNRSKLPSEGYTVDLGLSRTITYFYVSRRNSSGGAVLEACEVSFVLHFFHQPMQGPGIPGRYPDVKKYPSCGKILVRNRALPNARETRANHPLSHDNMGKVMRVMDIIVFVSIVLEMNIRVSWMTSCR